MTTTVAQLADTLQTLFTTTAQQLATDTGLIRRRRKLFGPSFAQGLVFTWRDNPHATREDLALAVAPDGLAAPSLDERFTPTAAEFLRRLLLEAVGHVIAAQPTAVALLRRFPGVYLLDSTGVTPCRRCWPTSGPAAAAVATTRRVKPLSRSRSATRGTAVRWRGCRCIPAAPPTPRRRWRGSRCPRGRCAWPIWVTSTWTCCKPRTGQGFTSSAACSPRRPSLMPTAARGNGGRCWRRARPTGWTSG